MSDVQNPTNTTPQDKKPKVGKSLLTLHIKPHDDESDIASVEAGLRAISIPGLVWGSSALVPLVYGLQTLQITIVISDDISVDELKERIEEEFEEHVKSVDDEGWQKL